MKKLSLVTGGGGLLGTALCSHLSLYDENVIAPTSVQMNLMSEDSIRNYIAQFSKQELKELHGEISCVYHLAAYVGGVKANSDRLATFFSRNCRMGLNILDACVAAQVPKVVSVMSTCVYPDTSYVTLPLSESQLHMGPPHSSNFGYAYAKRMLDVQTRAIRAQYKLPYVTVIPNNLFGANDNFHLEDGHAIPALIRKVWEAKITGADHVRVWGNGKPLREFTYAPDAAKILKIVSKEYCDETPLNIGCVEERSIDEVVRIICRTLNYTGNVVYETSKPMGQYRKPSTNKRLLESTSWKSSDYTPFEMAISETCKWFELHYPNVRGIE